MIEFNIASQAVQDALSRLQQVSVDQTPAWQSIGEMLVASTHQRFKEYTSPDGTPWEPLSNTTSTRKGHDRPLEGESRQLGTQIHYSADADGMEIGSIMEYAAMQHFGGTRQNFPHLWGDIPGRPFLGISEIDADQVVEIMADFLAANS